MKVIFSFIVLCGIISTVVQGAAPKAADNSISLKQRILLADVIVIAEVRAVEVVHSSDISESHKVTCAVNEVLKGQIRDNRKEIEVILNLKLKEKPKADRLSENKKYLLFLNGTWSYEPLTPYEGILQIADRYQIADTTFSHKKLLSKIREMVKSGPRIREVSIAINLAGGWSADFRVHSGGRTSGGHMSGGEYPFHHMEKGTLDGEPLATIIALADKVYNSDVPSNPVIRTSNIVYISIESFVEETKVYQRKVKETYKDKDLAELDRLLHKHHIGGW